MLKSTHDTLVQIGIPIIDKGYSNNSINQKTKPTSSPVCD